MEIFQLDSRSWFLPRRLFLEDPTLSTREQPIYCHNLSDTMTAEHLHGLTLTNYSDNLQLYQWRFQRNDAIVSIFNIEVIELIRLDAKVSVLCQKLFFDLEEVFSTLSIYEQIYVFRTVLEAANILGEKLGWFRLTSKMLGLNKRGYCRVWVHQNYACNEVQYPLCSLQEQFKSILFLFRGLQSKNKEFDELLEGIQKEQLNSQNIQRNIDKFTRQNKLSNLDGVDVDTLIQKAEKKGVYRYSEIKPRPSFTFKHSRQSTQMSKSNNNYSVFSNDSVVPSQQGINFRQSSKFKVRVPNKKNRQNSVAFPGSKLQVPNFSQLKTDLHFEQRDKQNFDFSPVHSLGIDSKLEESIQFESDFQMQKKPSFDINSLQKLGKIGTFCQSLTPQQLILQQFKDIYS